MGARRESLRLCLVTDRSFLRGTSLSDVVAAAVRGGVTSVQLREKTLDIVAFAELGRAIKELLLPLGVPLIINDHAEVAAAVGADGLHVGQSDLPAEAARALLGRNATIGLSITAIEQLRKPDVRFADYLGVGPIFATPTKPDAAEAMGLKGLAAARSMSALPMVAIGGISQANAAETMAAGANGVAVVSAIMGAADPEQAARALARAVGVTSA
ncbi:MAG TPA: thiamine phosphate synthase [Xanthobacteraceae bacterium]|nr:thiamine phosphate synthase [Xanthobacteraceae bacterium]